MDCHGHYSRPELRSLLIDGTPSAHVHEQSPGSSDAADVDVEGDRPCPPLRFGEEHTVADGASGNYSNSAITALHATDPLPTSRDEQILAAKISRAMSSGPLHITRDATVAEMDAQGNLMALRQGTNQWVCFPGDENEIGNVPMCADPMGLQWMLDIMGRQASPDEYGRRHHLHALRCNATQQHRPVRKNESCHFEVGPHWMIIWPYDAARDGLPNTVRDACYMGHVRWDTLRISSYLAKYAA